MTSLFRGFMAMALVMGLSTIFTGNANAQVGMDTPSTAGIEKVNNDSSNDNYDRDYNRENRRGYNYGHRGYDRDNDSRGYMHERRGYMHERGDRMDNDRGGRHHRGGGWGGNHHRGR